MTRIAVAGFGVATERMHLASIGAIGSAELVGGADTDAARRDEWIERTGAPAYDTLAELLAAGRPEVVVIATPPGTHHDLCLEAMEAGADVFCEKPLAPSAAEAERIVAAAESLGRRVAVNLHMRATPIFSAVRDELHGGEHGRPSLIQLIQRIHLPPAADQREWRAAMAARSMLEGGIHLVDLAIHLAGRAPQSVEARLGSGPAEADAGSDPLQLLTLDFGAGLLAQLTIQRLSRGGDRYVELTADCERTTLRASMGGRAMLQLGKKRAQRAGVRLDLTRGGLAWFQQGERRRKLAKNPPRADVHASRALLEAFLGDPAATPSSATPAVPAAESVAALRVIEAAYESDRAGRRIELEPPSVSAAGSKPS